MSTTQNHPASAVDQARAELDLERARWQIQAERDQARADRRERRAAERRRRRAEARARHRVGLARVGHLAKDLGPQLVVNAAAVYGQIAWVVDEVAPADWATGGKLALGALIAGAAESIAITVGWYAHDALLAKATATAARLRRGSYLIAAIIGAVNYAHFAGPGFRPTPLAVVLAVCSIMSPILWGLYSRRAQRIHLRAEGAADCVGATFSAERFRAFPLRTIGARRWSIEHNVLDPVEAWDGYNADRIERRRQQPAGRVRTAWSILSGAPIHTRSTPIESTGSDRPQIEARSIESAGAADPVPVVDRPAPDFVSLPARVNGSAPQSAGAPTPVVAAGANGTRRTTAKVPDPAQVADALDVVKAAIAANELPQEPSAEAIRRHIRKAPKIAQAVRDHLRDGTTPETP